jgi:hypothetical protein
VGTWFRLLLKLSAVTVVAFAVWIFALVTIRIGGIHSTNVSDAEIIRAQNPVRLVSPDWVSPRGDMFAWLQAETRARFVFVVVLWAIAGAYVTRQHFSMFGKSKLRDRLPGFQF